MNQTAIQFVSPHNRVHGFIHTIEANKCYMDEGVRLLELARNAQSLFAKQEPREKRRLLNFLLSKIGQN